MRRTDWRKHVITGRNSSRLPGTGTLQYRLPESLKE
jgi:hypothetical protein